MRRSMSKSAVRAVALVMATSMIGSTVVEAAEVTKDESVYVTLDSTGNVKKTIVSNWLHSDEKDITVIDKSNLDDIKNVKGDEEPRISGEKLTWNMEDTDLYYRGNSTSKLPLDVSVKYFLDDEECDPEDMAGKSGKIRIELEVKNTEFKDTEINGKTKRIYSPLTVAAVVTLPVDKFSAVTTDGGKMLSEGNNTIVGFACAPGLKESLDLDSIPLDIDFNDKLKDKLIVEADVENFSLGPIMITATPNLPADLNELDSATTISDVRDKLTKLQDGIDKIADGSTQINDGLQEANATKIEPMFNMLETSEIQDKLSLVMSDNKVARSRTLIKDAYFAKDLDTSKVNNLISQFNSGALINNVKGQVKQTLNGSVGEVMNNPAFSNYAKDVLKQNINGPLGNNVKGLLKDSIRSGAESGIDNFIATNKNKVNTKIDEGNIAIDSALDLYKQASPVLSLINDPIMKSLVEEVVKVKQNYNSLSKESREAIDAVLSLANPQLIMSAKNAITDGKSLVNDFSGVQTIVKETILNMPGNTVEEKTNNFIKTLNSTLISFQNLAQVDFSSMSQDITEYSSAYLVLKAQLIAAVKQEEAGLKTLEDTKKQLETIVSQVYASQPELAEGLKNYIASFNVSKITDTSDIAKLSYYKDLLSNVEKSTGTLKSLSPVLKAVTDVLGKENEGNKIINTLNELTTMVETLNPTLSKISSLSDQDKANLMNLVNSINTLKTDIDTNSNQIDQALATVSSLNVSDMVTNLSKLKGTLEETKLLVAQAQGLINTLNGKTLLDNIDFDAQFENGYNKVDINQLIDGIDINSTLSSLDINPIMNMVNVDGKIDSLVGQYKPLIDEANTMLPQLMNMQNDLKQSEDILRILNDCLKQNEINRARNLMNSLPDMQSQLSELTTGMQTLTDGIKQYKEEGIDLLNNKGNEALDKVDELKATKDELVNMANENEGFSGLGEDMKCTTKFVMKTAEIEEVDNDKGTDTEVKEEKKGFWAWLKSLLGLE